MSEDIIYREDAIKAINARADWYQVTCNGKQVAVMLMAKDVNECLEKVPPADRPQGEWITKTVKEFCAPDCWYPDAFAIEGSWNEEEGSWLEEQDGFCSNCGEQDEHYYSHRYCPYCGSRMKRTESYRND